MIYSGNGAGKNTLSDLETVVRQTTRDLRPHLDRFDSIVVRGNSGIIVGAPVSLRLKKPLVVIRKDDEHSHDVYGGIVNLKNIGRRAIFLDDFVASGGTRNAVKYAVADASPSALMVGEYMYHGESEWDIKLADWKYTGSLLKWYGLLKWYDREQSL